MQTPFTTVNDAHCHFFSAGFFEKLGRQLDPQLPPRQVVDRLGWEWPGETAQLAERWIRELDGHHVKHCALMASLPGEEAAVQEAVRMFPDRLVGMFMADPTADGAPRRTVEALASGRLRVVCLFPAMHGYRLDSELALNLFRAADEGGARAVFVHCGQLSVGVRKMLGLPSRFDVRLGNPLDLHPALSAHLDLPVILPHFGAGFSREALMLADMHPNVHLDTSSSNSWVKFHFGLTLQQVFAQALQVLGPARLLFGTDSSFFPRGWQAPILRQQRQLVRGLGVSAADQEAIFRGNFERLLCSQEPVAASRGDR